MNIRALATTLGGSVTGPQSLTMPGPGHSKADRSLSVMFSPSAPDGLVVHTFCPGDDDLDCKRHVLDALGWERSRRRDLRDATKRRHLVVAPEPTPDPRAVSIWRGAGPVEGSPAELYLRARGFNTWPPSLRFSASEGAMVAALQVRDRQVCAVQMTRLTDDGKKKWSDDCRRTVGAMHGAAVRLAPAGPVLGLAEGTESGLAAMALTNIPVWASLGAKRLSRVVIPDFVERIEVFADDDAPGREAAELVVKTHRDRHVVVHLPPENICDWNDWHCVRKAMV